MDTIVLNRSQEITHGLARHTNEATSNFVTENLLASCGEDGRVILWEAARGTKLREWQLPGVVARIAFAHDGRHLATANGNGTVSVQCPAGTQVLSGGGGASSFLVFGVESFQSGNGWIWVARNTEEIRRLFPFFGTK